MESSAGFVRTIRISGHIDCPATATTESRRAEQRELEDTIRFICEALRNADLAHRIECGEVVISPEARNLFDVLKTVAAKAALASVMFTVGLAVGSEGDVTEFTVGPAGVSVKMSELTDAQREAESAALVAERRGAADASHARASVDRGLEENRVQQNAEARARLTPKLPTRKGRSSEGVGKAGAVDAGSGTPIYPPSSPSKD